MASTLELPVKSTRRMTPDEVRFEAGRLGIPNHADADVEELRRLVSTEVGKRWREENRDAIESMNAWVEKHGLPLERYRLF